MMSRRRRKRRRRRGTAEGGLVERIWSVATDVRAPGLLLLMCGILLAITPWLRTPEPLVSSWWDAALYAPGAIGVAAGLAGVAVVLLLGVLWNRYSLVTDPGHEESTIADASLDIEAREIADDTRLPGLAWLGGICMVAGIATVVGYWFAAQQNLGAARVSLTPGETIESYTVPYGQQGLDVMLPLRVKLAGIEAGDEPVAKLQLFSPGQDPPKPQPVSAGSGMELDGFRLTFVGVSPQANKLRAVIASDAPNTIKAAAGEGEAFKLALEGKEYKVVEIARNYMGVMGPAVKVRAPDIGEFWVFQRGSDVRVKPDLDHQIVLESLQTQPAAVLTVAKTQPFWPISVGGTLFVLGFALLIVFPERIVRRDDGKLKLWSFNEAGRVAEQVIEGEG